MHYSDVDICNLALAQLKVRPIGSMKDNTEEARQCRKMYPFALSQVLSLADWNFCRTKRRLAKLDIGWIDWGYITNPRLNYFKYPEDAIKLLDVQLRNEHTHLDPAPHHHHHHHDDDDTTVSEDDSEDVEEEDEEEVSYDKKHHHHRGARKTPELPRIGMPYPILKPTNDDGYQLQSIKLIHQHVFFTAIVTPFNRVDVEYIRYEPNPQYWPPMFTEAVVRCLSYQLATLLSGKSDSIQIQQQAFEVALRRAAAANGNDRKSTLHQFSRLLRGCF